MDVSSSGVRQLLAAGAELRGIVPDAVVKYITAHRLYA